VLLTTQYLDEADQLAGRIAIIDHGRVIADGSPAELKRRVGGHVVEVRAQQRGHLAPIAEALAGLEHRDVEIDEAIRSVRVRGGALTAALGAIEALGVAVDEIALRQPTLDEVFLALTGHSATHQEIDKSPHAEAVAA